MLEAAGGRNNFEHLAKYSRGDLNLPFGNFRTPREIPEYLALLKQGTTKRSKSLAGDRIPPLSRCQAMGGGAPSTEPCKIL